MGDRFDFLENVGTRKGHWRFQVYAARMWKEMYTKNTREVNSIEKVFQDIKSGRIQASIPRSMFKRHGNSIKECKMYVISNFIVRDKKTNYKGKTSVQSHFQFSKLHIDPTLSDVKEFHSRLIGDTPSSSVRIAQVSSQGGSSGIAELRRGTAVVKTIEQVMVLEEEGQVWIAGRIMGINAGQNDWSNQACTSCDKKVEEGNNGKYKCKNCKTDEAEAELSNEVNEDSGVVSLEQTNDAGAIVGMMDDFVTDINMKTPGKKSATSVKHCASKQPEQEADGQHSTNRFSRKGLKRGKIQLNDKDN
ncbi:hypothetical protein PIB30_082747 [Stylosanthes scabra]|uniref:Replication protein A 70 kDa DNA-binding subunit B/D first OB fold domain-containing protein n=1 Tax=Stylosanthes scabra TaxID=79078 RepID=A0ABU6ZQN6_9FABA|nr:hypothetical protein [Stylosanthes scabra]